MSIQGVQSAAARAYGMGKVGKVFTQANKLFTGVRVMESYRALHYDRVRIHKNDLDGKIKEIVRSVSVAEEFHYVNGIV